MALRYPPQDTQKNDTRDEKASMNISQQGINRSADIDQQCRYNQSLADNIKQERLIESLQEMIACLSDTLKQVVAERDLLKAELEAVKESTNALKRALDITRQELKNAQR